MGLLDFIFKNKKNIHTKEIYEETVLDINENVLEKPTLLFNIEKKNTSAIIDYILSRIPEEVYRLDLSRSMKDINLVIKEGFPQKSKKLQKSLELFFSKFENLDILFLIKEGFDASIEFLYKHTNQSININILCYDNSLLANAVILNKYKVVELLLLYGASPNSKICLQVKAPKYDDGYSQGDFEQYTVLIYAVKHNQIEIVKELLGCKNDFNEDNNNICCSPYSSVVNIKNKTALMYAAENKNLKILDLLLSEDNSVVNNVDDSGRTALMYASISGNAGIVNQLLSHNADINYKDQLGKTALFLAIENGTTDELKEMLVSNGANDDLEDFEGNSQQEPEPKEELLNNDKIPIKIRKKLLAIILKYTDIDVSLVYDNSDFRSDLKLDSLDQFHISEDIECEFKINYDKLNKREEELMISMYSINDLYDFLVLVKRVK